MYRKQLRNYGGVAILIKSRLPHNFKEILNFKFIEISTLELYVNNEVVVIRSVYHPPSQETDIKEYNELLELLITNVFTHHWKPEPYIVPPAIVQTTSQAK